jgi:hydrogenase maturation protease
MNRKPIKAPRIAVLGLGNLMRTDDAVGMLALQRLRADSRFPQSVPLIEGGTLGLDLIYPLEGYTHLLALDAIDAGVQPGTVLRYSGQAMADLPISKSVHLLGFSDLIGSMRLIGNAPAEIVVLGVQPHTIAWGTELTAPVDAALDILAEQAIAQVKRWSGSKVNRLVANMQAASAVPELATIEEAWYW